MIDWKDQSVLITGGSGFVGYHLSCSLWDAGAKVYSRNSVDGDLRKEETAIKLLAGNNPDIVYHLAANVGGIGLNRAHPATLLRDNALMGIHLVDACARHGVKKLVCLGSVCGYPKHCPTPFIEENFWDGYPEETNAAYGTAKRLLLVHLQAAREEYGLNGVYVIPTNLYGPVDTFDPKKSHVIPALIRRFENARINNDPYVSVWGTGKASRDFLYVKDLAEALKIIGASYEAKAPLNLGSGMEVRIDWLVSKIKELVGYEGEIRWDTSKPDGQPRRVLNTSRVEVAVNWKATTPLEEGLKETIEWYRSVQNV